ncbi:MAG TPA: RibD family protein, partial [bacterium]|nr:RibD family protein [bacterium]
DDPLLTTRLTNGEDPKPIIVDSHLRTPWQCNLLRNNQVNPLVATTEFAEEQALNDLQSMGAEILITAATQDRRVDLGALLRKLYERNLKTVMVEGGSQILTSFFNEQLVNLLVLTIAPQILGGLPGIRELTPDPEGARPSLREVRHALIGKDLMVWGAIHWSTS